ncbi:MAG: GntR family transcriptional regulator [Thermodesulfobacteriota bacterium]
MPIREALIGVEELQLVRKKRRGREVAQISLKDFEELFELKILLESYAAAQGCQISSPSLVNKLRKLGEMMDKCLTPSAYQRLRKTNHEFHNLVVESAQNRRLYNFYLQILKQIRWATHISPGQPGCPEVSNKEHKEIC